MSMLFAGIAFGVLVALGYGYARGSGATTEPVLPFGAPETVDSARLVLSMKRRSR